MRKLETAVHAVFDKINAVIIHKNQILTKTNIIHTITL